MKKLVATCLFGSLLTGCNLELNTYENKLRELSRDIENVEHRYDSEVPQYVKKRFIDEPIEISKRLRFDKKYANSERASKLISYAIGSSANAAQKYPEAIDDSDKYYFRQYFTWLFENNHQEYSEVSHLLVWFARSHDQNSVPLLKKYIKPLLIHRNWGPKETWTENMRKKYLGSMMVVYSIDAYIFNLGYIGGKAAIAELNNFEEDYTFSSWNGKRSFFDEREVEGIHNSRLRALYQAVKCQGWQHNKKDFSCTIQKDRDPSKKRLVFNILFRAYRERPELRCEGYENMLRSLASDIGITWTPEPQTCGNSSLWTADMLNRLNAILR